ncbi:MAG: FtsW/RodA/SpoVE family cell cycle protein, partial [Alphaproteobacteria bacterium]
LLIALPVFLVLRQPDLGTATMLAATGLAVWFLAGVFWKLFAAGAAALTLAMPVAWSLLRDYQKDRVLTFINPERDPLGAGYHILQSKIALGSGGLSGRGYMEGTQSHLSFLPESQTDFVFTMLAEEFGLIGALSLVALYALIIFVGMFMAWQARSPFARLLGAGLVLNFFLYVLINIAMVTGLMPVVGVPLPLVSYGGTAMLTLMIGFGLLMSIHVHRDTELPRGDATLI